LLRPPRTKATYGFVGLYDFPSDIRRVHEEEGWTYHSRVTIWKDPVVEMTRTKALGLLHKQLLKDSSRSRVGMPDYLLVFSKTPTDEAQFRSCRPRPRKLPRRSVAEMGIASLDGYQPNQCAERPGRARQQRRETPCPLQLDVIDRAIRLWSNPGDVVLSPFMGIGSEGVMALRSGRKFIGTELKPSYFKQACKFLSKPRRAQRRCLIRARPQSESRWPHKSTMVRSR
jgi:hypothetical protein